MSEIERRLTRIEPYLVAGVAVTYFVIYSVLSVLRHVTYHSFGPDLGIFDQVFWNTTQGRVLESTMSLAQRCSSRSWRSSPMGIGRLRPATAWR